ncbi:hypothetical protein Ahy_A02g006429 [Arachis hypogaea]|uniref:Reverse transcriptase zinc-binding domain-containing protein n=1 Tax=Arachis hypogaea TaxID=3818 RepID=A0A445E9S4_ARAHY|nr:hypothetical protein Ahy_A02g006429 [Arachis hypogaea]
MRDRKTMIVKAKINIDAARQVRDQLIVAGPNKKEVEVALRYERLGKFCTCCAKLGHEVKNCHDLLKDTKSDMVKDDDIGELKLPYKIKVFLWKSLHEKLPVLQQVQSRFASTSATCPRCMLKAESISHALFQYPLFSIIWSLSLITLDERRRDIFQLVATSLILGSSSIRR